MILDTKKGCPPRLFALALGSLFIWCQLPDSDQPPADYKSAALPDELSWHFTGECYRDRTYDLFRVKEALSR